MEFYILITDTKECKINNFILDSISGYIEASTGKKILLRELSSNKAYEWVFSKTIINEETKNWINSFLSSHNIDCNFIKSGKNRKKKLLLADMDSTIIEEESLDQLGKLIGKEKNIIEITEDAMNGIIDFEEALIRRVAMLKGHSADILDILKEKININLGAKELIKTMNFNGSKTILVSGGFTFLTEYLKSILGFTYAHANSLEITQQKGTPPIISGKVIEPILNKNSKLEYLRMYIEKYKLNDTDTICVGDGANDIEMIKNADFGVSFNGKKILDEEANIHFKNTNLRGLLYAQGYSDKEIIK